MAPGNYGALSPSRCICGGTSCGGTQCFRQQVTEFYSDGSSRVVSKTWKDGVHYAPNGDEER